jgi:hypothetical protein
MLARKVQGVEMPNLDDNEPEIVFGPDYGKFIDSTHSGEDCRGKSLKYAEPKDTQKEAILKVARQIAASNDDDEQAGLFFTRVVQAFVLLDQMAPQFIELVDEYHIGENPQATDCHLCKLRAAAEEYLAEREKINV